MGNHIFFIFIHRPGAEKSEEIREVWNNAGIVCTVQFCAVSVAYISELCGMCWSHHDLDNIFVILFGPNLFTFALKKPTIVTWYLKYHLK